MCPPPLPLVHPVSDRASDWTRPRPDATPPADARLHGALATEHRADVPRRFARRGMVAYSRAPSLPRHSRAPHFSVVRTPYATAAPPATWVAPMQTRARRVVQSTNNPPAVVLRAAGGQGGVAMRQPAASRPARPPLESLLTTTPTHTRTHAPVSGCAAAKARVMVGAERTMVRVASMATRARAMVGWVGRVGGGNACAAPNTYKKK